MTGDIELAQTQTSHHQLFNKNSSEVNLGHLALSRISHEGEEIKS